MVKSVISTSESGPGKYNNLAISKSMANNKALATTVKINKGKAKVTQIVNNQKLGQRISNDIMAGNKKGNT
jgi:hypothetical protein